MISRQNCVWRNQFASGDLTVPNSEFYILLHHDQWYTVIQKQHLEDVCLSISKIKTTTLLHICLTLSSQDSKLAISTQLNKLSFVQSCETGKVPIRTGPLRKLSLS